MVYNKIINNAMLDKVIYKTYLSIMEHTLAIDFGTTNSTVYLLRNGKEEQLRNNEVTGDICFHHLLHIERMRL